MKITEHRTREILNLLGEFADHAPMFEEISKRMFRDTATLIRQLQAAEQEAWLAGLDAGREQGKGIEHCRTEPQPVAWYTDDHLTDKSATTYNPVVRDRWIAKGWPVTPLYAAPPSVPKKEVDYTDIANRVQEITGRSIWPSTVKAVLEVAGHPAHPSAPVGVEDWLIGDLMEAEEGGHTAHTPAELCGLAAKALKSLIAQQPGGSDNGSV